VERCVMYIYLRAQEAVRIAYLREQQIGVGLEPCDLHERT